MHCGFPLISIHILTILKSSRPFSETSPVNIQCDWGLTTCVLPSLPVAGWNQPQPALCSKNLLLQLLKFYFEGKRSLFRVLLQLGEQLVSFCRQVSVSHADEGELQQSASDRSREVFGGALYSSLQPLSPGDSQQLANQTGNALCSIATCHSNQPKLAWMNRKNFIDPRVKFTCLAYSSQQNLYLLH